MYQYLIIGITYAFAAVVQPGPLQTYLVSQTLARGWRRTIPAAFAPLFSDGPIIILMLLLLSNMPYWLVSVLQTAGGVFILYLAYTTYITWRTFELNRKIEAGSDQRTLIQAVIINLLNPNPYLGWSLVMGPLLIKGWHESPANGIALLIGFYAAIVAGCILIILIFAATGNLGTKLNRILIGISAAVLMLFGFYELWIGIKDVINYLS